jgi:DNA-binding Lrp family transcriptional regulator
MIERGRRNLTKELQEKKEKYLDIFDSIDYVPTFDEIGKILNKSEEEVLKDIKELGIIRAYRLIPYYIKLRERLSIYNEFYFDAKNSIPLREIAKQLGISENQAYKDVHYLQNKLGIRKQRGNCASVISINKKSGKVYTFKSIEHRAHLRRPIYDLFIKEKGYVPYYIDFEREFGISAKEVKSDFEILGYKPITYVEDAINKRKEKLLGRLEFYKKYYIDAEIPLTMEELGRKLGVTKQTVSRDLQYIKEYFGVYKKSK